MNITLDPTDRRLLALLQADASLTNQALAERAHISAATCLRRVRRLVESGVIERTMAIVSPDALGVGNTAVLEVTLDRQDAARLEAFETHVAQEPAVQQCYRVAAGPDFVLIVYVADMPAYHAFVQRSLTAEANVRNVRAFFAVKRSKFVPAVPV
ncbi:MAG: Lrp/AsnC family transcriptional regulator [Burkholderiales bacterium]|jgi:Lrp/AsnC family leucine-responsive transcriptional regulator|nr:Lrp/AsnC family transcriptional regulator [Burkholderiales bacterium]